MKGGEITKMQNLKVDGEKVRLIMARNTMNPYDLCSGAQISYASYRRIMKEGIVRLPHLEKLQMHLVLMLLKYWQIQKRLRFAVRNLNLKRIRNIFTKQEREG